MAKKKAKKKATKAKRRPRVTDLEVGHVLVVNPEHEHSPAPWKQAKVTSIEPEHDRVHVLLVTRNANATPWAEAWSLSAVRTGLRQRYYLRQGPKFRHMEITVSFLLPEDSDYQPDSLSEIATDLGMVLHGTWDLSLSRLIEVEEAVELAEAYGVDLDDLNIPKEFVDAS
jgi:hypothetical protein